MNVYILFWSWSFQKYFADWKKCGPPRSGVPCLIMTFKSILYTISHNDV